MNFDDFDPFDDASPDDDGDATGNAPGNPADVRIIAIGALDAHPLRNERDPVRTAYSTTTLIRAGRRTILIDPGLPAQALIPRLDERAGLKPTDITHIFLTCFRPDVRRALPAFPHATWWISADERESVGVPLAHQLRHAEETQDSAARDVLLREVALLHQCQPAPDTLAPGVSLFPLPGVTPGLAGILVAQDRFTLLICGDAIPTIEHLDAEKAPRWAADIDRARESFSEALDIADLLILGRDPMVLNPTKRLF